MIRRFMEKDLDEVMAIWLSTTIKAHHFIDEDYWRRAEEVVRSEYIPQAVTYVYLKDEKVVGFVSILSEDTIGALFIDEKYQSRGIGSQLIDYVKTCYNLLAVSVYEKNRKALEFYKSHDFVYDYKQNDLNTGQVEFVLIFRNKNSDTLFISKELLN
ncbi:MAG: N-acetyltransferase [Peptostreptococcales bacterium]|jgi:putative acetyltransferase